jgi:hypothetical protein
LGCRLQMGRMMAHIANSQPKASSSSCTPPWL